MTAEKVKYTPGPLEVCEPGDYSDYAGDCVVVCGDGRRIAIFFGSGAEAKANARLFATSRILLEVLKLCAAGFTPYPGTSDLDNEQPIWLRITLGDYRRMGHIYCQSGDWAMNRIWHFLTQHQWRIASAAYVPPSHSVISPYSGLSRDEKLCGFGFTEIVEKCECGARRFATVFGNHSGLKSDSELVALERMMR